MKTLILTIEIIEDGLNIAITSIILVLEVIEYLLVIIKNIKKIEAWHGWLAHVYDDVPTRTGESNFYEPVH